MTKTKLFLPLFVILVMGMATSAFAQLSCSVASTPVSRDTSTGHAEQAGDLIFNCTGGPTATTPATITVGYGVTITNSTTHPPLQPIAITNATGVFAGATAPSVAAGGVSNATGQVVITVPANPAGVGLVGSFSLVGVRVSLNGTGLTSLSANVSVSPGNGVLITAGQNVATVVTAILAGINTTTAPPALVAGTQSALYFASNGTAVPGRGTFAFTVTENYIDAFRDSTQIAGATNDVQILVTLAGLPTGTSITGCTAAISGAATAVQVNGGVVAATIAAATPTMTLDFVGPTNISAVETITVTCTGFGFPATALPLSATITGTVTLAPIGQALSAAGAVLTTVPGTTVTSGSVPRYASSTSSLGTLLSFTPSTTTMIIPFAMGDPSTTAAAGTFDTGIAIANTTADTVGGTSIFTTGGAVAQAGTITFTFFPSDGAAANRFSITTAAATASGASYIANVSEILRAGGRTTSFTGYIIAVANFTNAHGTAFVYGGNAVNSRLTSATDLLVIPSPIAAGRSTVNGVALSLVEDTSK